MNIENSRKYGSYRHKPPAHPNPKRHNPNDKHQRNNSGLQPKRQANQPAKLQRWQPQHIAWAFAKRDVYCEGIAWRWEGYFACGGEVNGRGVAMQRPFPADYSTKLLKIASIF